MGLSQAIELSSNEDLSLATQLSIHFSSNCYPPIPQQMIPTAIEAIYAYQDEELEKLIQLPEGVSFRGRATVEAWQLINSYRLGAWCESDTEDEEEY